MKFGEQGVGGIEACVQNSTKIAKIAAKLGMTAEEYKIRKNAIVETSGLESTNPLKAFRKQKVKKDKVGPKQK